MTVVAASHAWLRRKEFPDALSEFALPFLEKCFGPRPANIGESLTALE